MEKAVNNNKLALLNGQKVNIVNDVSESDDAEDVIEADTDTWARRDISKPYIYVQFSV